MLRRLSPLLALALALVACGPSGICTADELELALTGAAPGSTVTVGACRIDGAFTVPAGVSIRGAGPASTIAGDGSAPTLTLEGGSSTISDLTLASPRRAALVSRRGQLVLRDVRVDVAAGVGVAVEDLASLELTRVAIVGPVTPENVSAIAIVADRATTATQGLAALRVGSIAIDTLAVSGFAEAGAILEQSSTVARALDVSGNRRLGLAVYGGSAMLEGTTACGMLASSYAATSVLIGADARVSSTDLEVCDGEGDAIVHVGSSGSHVRADVHGMAGVGVWIVGSDDVVLDGGALEDNAGSGLVVADSTAIVLRDLRVAGTRDGMRLARTLEPRTFADGIQVLREDASSPPLGLIAERLTLEGNGRAGLLIDAAGGALDGVDLIAVSAEATGTALGVVAQSVAEPRPSDWDADVERLGAASSNDLAFTGGMPVVSSGVVMPPVLVGTIGSLVE